MTHYHAQAGGHKLRVLTHETDLPVVVKLSCGALAGAVAQTGRLPLLYVLVSYSDLPIPRPSSPVGSGNEIIYVSVFL